jgi:hypothetical protein
MSRRKLYVCDAETTPFAYKRKIEPFLWGIFDGKTITYFDNTRKFIDHCKKLRGVCYAHNGGKFDFHFLISECNSDDFELWDDKNFLIINNRLSKIKIGEMEFRDSYNLFPMKLAGYKKDDIDYSLFMPGVRENHMQEIKEYLDSDLIYLYEMCEHFENEYGRNITLASSAMKYFKQNFHSIKSTKSSFVFDKLQPYYFGGRTQCFFKGEINQQVKWYDINSAYPFVMKEYKMPYGNFKIYSDLPKNENDFKNCFINIIGISKNSLPLRTKTGVDFPNDDVEREYFISGFEYLAALKHNSLKVSQIKEVIIFEDEIDFSGYVDHFYTMKKCSKKGSLEYISAKLFLNSLYGKFGTNPENYDNNFLCEVDDIELWEKEGAEFVRPFSTNTALMKTPREADKKRYFNLGTASAVTGAVRAYLFDNFFNVDTPLYCDTDSIACYDNISLDVGPELGQWELEGTFKKGGIVGKKTYAFYDAENDYWKIASKGVNADHKQILKACQGSVVEIESRNPTFTLAKMKTNNTNCRYWTGDNYYYQKRKIKIT